MFFDVGDTLIRAQPSWAGVYRAGLLEFGIDVAEAQLEKALLDETQAGAWWVNEDPFEPTPEESYRTIVRFDGAVLRRLGYDDLPDDAFRRIEDAFAKRASWHVFPDVLASLEALTAAGIRMGIISNFVWGGIELFHDLELASHFDSLTVSARVGFQKPHEGIFRHALEALGARPEASWHIGDSYRADIFGGRRAGMTAVLIDRGGTDPARIRQEREDPDLLVIHDLYELLDLLGLERPALAAV